LSACFDVSVDNLAWVISAWGVIVSTVVSLGQLYRGSIVAANPQASIERLMIRKGCTAEQAGKELRSTLLWLLFPVTVMLAVLFLNGIYGWSPFYIQSRDWITLLAFSVGSIYLCGAFAILLCAAMGVWTLYGIRELSKRIARDIRSD
jgi:hypothetical protein